MPKNIRSDERGLASIIVAFAIIIILSLVTLGFAQYARREQRQVLDRQLSTQAYYAAESGVNDAINAIKAKSVDTAGDLIDDNCESETPARPTDISGQKTVLYSCQLIDRVVPDIIVDSVTVGQKKNSTNELFGRYFVINPVDPNNQATTVTPMAVAVEWETDKANSVFSTKGEVDSASAFTPYDGWRGGVNSGRPDVLRVVLYDNTGIADPTNDNESVSLTRQKLLYLVPTSDGGESIEVSSMQSGSVIPVRCDPISPSRPYACSIRLSNSAGFPANGKLGVGVMNTYKQLDNTALRLRAFDDTNGTNALLLKDSQYRVDVTGKSADVRRRIQVRIPFGRSQRQTVNYVLESAESICKDLHVSDSTGPLQYPNQLDDNLSSNCK